MAQGTTTSSSHRNNATIILPIEQEEYEKIVQNPKGFRRWLDQHYKRHPELFPKKFAAGYKLHDTTTSRKTGITTRRIELRNKQHWTIHPSFVMPYMTGMTEEIAKALYLRKYSVPYEGLVYVFEKDVNYWIRIETQFGRKNIVATTVKTGAVPVHLLADEHHEKILGNKTYLATTVAEGVVLGAEVTSSAGTEELEKAYGVFKSEALSIEPEYKPRTVNTDGWAGTMGAWSALFPTIVLIRCFLHSWLKIRDRAKHLKELFFEMGEKVWEVYHAPTRGAMGQRIRRLMEWSKEKLSGEILKQVAKLCALKGEWSLWYDHPESYMTSNMLDRLMRSQNKYFDRGQHFHGDIASANLRSRSWAVLHNYWDWGKRTAQANGGARCPAERLNGKRYADCWLENLLVATSAVQNTKKTAP